MPTEQPLLQHHAPGNVSDGYPLQFQRGSRRSPDRAILPVLHPAVIAGAASAAERTVIPVPCTGTGLDPEVNDTILIRVEIVGFYNGVLDIEQFLA